MSLVSRYGRACPQCHRPVRRVFGSQQWHARNDPAGGYCHCDLDVLKGPLSAPATPADAVVCSTCEGRKVLGIPGASCPMCKGTGWDALATEAQRLDKSSARDSN